MGRQQGDLWRRSLGQGVGLELGVFDVLPPRAHVFESIQQVESQVNGRVLLQVGGGQIEQGHGRSESAFLEVHKGSGPLDESLVEGVIGPGFTISQPEFFKDIMGFEVEPMVEAPKEAQVVPGQSLCVRSVGIQVCQERGDAGAFVAHGRNSGRNGQGTIEPRQRKDLSLGMMRTMTDPAG